MPTLIENSKVRIATAVSIVGLTLWIGWHAARSYTLLMDLKESAYTLPQASELAMRAAMANPGLKVPDPRDPTKFFHVTSTGPTSHMGDTPWR